MHWHRTCMQFKSDRVILPNNVIKYVLISLLLFRPKVGLNFVDHVVGNQPDKQMEPVAKWYNETNQNLITGILLTLIHFGFEFSLFQVRAMFAVSPILVS